MQWKWKAWLHIPPGHSALLAGGTRLVGLTLDAQVHDVVPADRAVVHLDVPGPEGHSIPLAHLKSFLNVRTSLQIQGHKLYCHCEYVPIDGN